MRRRSLSSRDEPILLLPCLGMRFDRRAKTSFHAHMMHRYSFALSAVLLAMAMPASAQDGARAPADGGDGNSQAGVTPKPEDPYAISPEERSRRLANWFSNDDYPVAALKAGAEGDTTISWTISTAGLVTNCRVVKSSGNADLDARSCEMLTLRARYRPALDQNGNPIESSATRSVRWRLPK